MIAEVGAGLAGAVGILGLGLAMGFSPSMYAIVIRLMDGASQPVVVVRWVVLGMVIGCTVLLIAFRGVDPTTLAHAFTSETERLLVRRGIDLAAGVVFAGLAVWQFFRSRRPRPEQKLPEPRRPRRPAELITIGFSNTVVGVSGAATMYVAGRLITSTSHHLWIQVLLYLLFILGTTGPYLVAAAAWQRYPALSAKVDRVYARLSRIDARRLVTIGLAVAAVVFLCLGIWGPPPGPHPS